MTDNLLKRGIEKPPECMFCAESESIQHLFFDCVVAKLIWEQVATFFDVNIGASYISVAQYWPANSNHSCLNSIAPCVLWSIWKLRNDHVFNNAYWCDINQVLWRILANLRWKILFIEKMLERIEDFSSKISCLIKAPFLLTVG